MDSQRRIFLLSTARIAALAAAGGALSGSSASAATRLNGAGYPFALGVASGSPLPDAVVLWTRICYDPLHASSTPAIALTVHWEIADDDAFRRIVARGSAQSTPELAHSVHVDVGGLAPGRWYWYRFMFGDAVSPVGRTRTAPAPDTLPATLKLAVASCQHWEFGAYAAHRHIAAAAPDLVAFLGDYIYEWGPYQLQHPARAVRTNESFTLDEYRSRYAQYKSDLDLQGAHEAAPWIVTWDDHEVSNDYANDRDELLTPNFLERRAAAYQAFYEHMPLRLLPLGRRGFVDMRIYQRYDWGRLARFHVLDDRQYRAHHACARPGRGGSNSITTRACPDLLKAERTMLGEEQQRWLQAGLDKSPARWNILAQQTLMAQSSQVPIQKPGDERIWTDGWDGYPMARQHLLNSLHSSGARNPLVLSGDVHTFYATELSQNAMRPTNRDNPVIATEFCGTSITSSSRPQARTAEYVAMNPHIRYGRSDKRGYMLLNITPEKTTTLFLGLDNVRDSASNIATLANFTVHDGKPGLQSI